MENCRFNFLPPVCFQSASRLQEQNQYWSNIKKPKKFFWPDGKLQIQLSASSVLPVCFQSSNQNHVNNSKYLQKFEKKLQNYMHNSVARKFRVELLVAEDWAAMTFVCIVRIPAS